MAARMRTTITKAETTSGYPAIICANIIPPFDLKNSGDTRTRTESQLRQAV